MKPNIKNYSFPEILSIFNDNGFPKYRAEQLFKEIYVKRVISFDEMSLLPKEIKSFLNENYSLESFTDTKKFTSIDKSVKLLFTLNDGEAIESVLMPWYDSDNENIVRTTLCVSSQVGCGLDCKFCATGTMGLIRNLEAHEIISQVIEAERQTKSKITNIVYMGMGEPLLNFRNVKQSILNLTDPMSNIISRKRITVSTSGIVPKIKKLAELKPNVKLAISLHATTNGFRDKIVPINQKSNINQLMNAVEDYYRITKKAITYEYIPFDGQNDTEADAKRLAKISKRVPSRVNIIPFNDISFTNPSGFATTLKPSTPEKIIEFAKNIRKYGGVVTIRETFGKDINAACGQLALNEKK